MSSKVIVQLMDTRYWCVPCNILHTDFHTSAEGEVDLGVMGGGGEIGREPQDSDKVRLAHYICHVV